MSFGNIEPEFVAVVLASTVGARLFPLTRNSSNSSSSAHDEDHLPKHLLPAVGISLLERLLTTSLQDFSNVFVAIAADDHTTVSTMFENSDLWTAANEAAAAASSSATTTTATTDPTTPFPQPHSVWKKQHAASSSSSNNNVSPQQSVTVVRMPEECPGSAEVLRQLEGLLPASAHALVVPADLMVTDDNNNDDGGVDTTISALVQAHRQGQSNMSKNQQEVAAAAACTLLLSDVGEQDEQGVPLKESAKPKKGGLARDPEDIEYMALAFSSPQQQQQQQSQTTTTTTARVLWKQGKLAAEQNEAFTLTGQTPKLMIPKARLRQHGAVVKMRQDWNDLHTYVLSPWVVRLVQAKTFIVSLQRDLVPLLVRRQFLGKVETFGQGVESHRVAEILEEDGTETDPAAVTSSLVVSHHALSPKDANVTTSTTSSAAMKPGQTYSVLAHVGTGAMRCSSTAAYLYASKDLLQKLTSGPTKASSSSLPAGSSTNTKFHSVILPDTQIGDKPTLKCAVVGRNCRLGNKCRLNNVIVMDNVQLGDNVVLQNTIVSKGVTMGDNCSLNDCQVAAGIKVASGTKEKGEVLVDTAGTM